MKPNDEKKKKKGAASEVDEQEPKDCVETNGEASNTETTAAQEDAIAALEAQVAQLQQELAQKQELLLRTAAEYDNFRKRTAKEKESTWTNAKAETVAEFLPALDNLDRAAAAQGKDEDIRKGIEMIHQQFNDALKKLGVEEIPAVGQPLDPNLHHAVMHVEDEEHGEGEIVECFQKGFKTGDRVIRYSMVKVAN